jgi:hypothetical protein
MTQQSEERLPASASDPSSQPATARILPFERPQSDLQRAIQVRAQEAIERDRDRDREERRPQPLKWIIIFAIALIPVILIFGAVDGFLRAFYKVNETYNALPAQQSVEQTTPEMEPPAQSSTPGVVLLQPYDSPMEAPAKDAPAAQPTETAPRSN